VAEVKNYGLSGVHRTLQLGKQGPVLVGNADTDSFTVTLQDAATLTTMGGANASSPEHFITKAQLDVVYTEAQFLANVNYNDSSPVLLGNISSGTKTIITTFEVDTAFDGNAIITVGTSSDNSLLMSDSYAEIEVSGSYQTTGLFEFASDTSLNIYVTQGGATQGSGKVLVSVVDGPVVDGGTINYGAGGSSTGNFVFNGNNLELSGGGSDDMYIKSPDDLYLDALNDDVILRAEDDIRLRTGYNFTDDTYQYELRFNDSAQLVFYSSSTSSDHGHILMTTDVGNSQRVLSFVGNEQVYITTDLENSAKTWKFDRGGNLTLPAGGDIKDSTGTSVLGTGGIALTDISVSVAASPSGNGSLSYDNTTGAFTFTPADLSSVAGNYGNSNVVTLLSSFGSNTIITTGNISGANLVSTVTVNAGVDLVAGNVANTSATKTRITSFGASSYIQTGNGSVGSTGNIVFAPYADATEKVVINTATGNVTAQNFNGNINITGNVTGTSPNVTLVAGSYSATMDNAGFFSAPTLKSTNASGNEGGEIQLALAPNATISGGIVVDSYVDRVRIFESGGTTRGAYIDLSQAAAGVGTLLNNRVSGLVNAGTFVTMDLIKATVTSSGNRGLSLAATTGSFNINISATYGGIGGAGGAAGTGTINTTPSSSQFGWNFASQAEASTYIITDTTNNRAYRITLQIGASFNNNLISIERLV
jgi:hypothetical protein